MHLKKIHKKLALLFSGGLIAVTTGFLTVPIEERKVGKDKPWSEKMALSVMLRNPKPWNIDLRQKPKWEYTQGLVLKAIEKVADSSKNKEFQQYILDYADYYVQQNGEINTYEIDEFNLDKIAPGRVLFRLHAVTKDKKYLQALQTLRRQLKWQPRTTEGGFWHKLRYPWQMWLDGLYMASPFYAEYAKRFEEPTAFDDIVKQLLLVEKHTRNDSTGLLYHGWDESAIQAWANPKTGVSPNFWGRAVGWYMMAIVDILEYLPKNHPERAAVVNVFKRLTDAVEKYQDKDTGLWYQVLNKKDGKGNYLESSVSCMFVYAIARGVHDGHLEKAHLQKANTGFDGILKKFITTNKATGEVTIHQGCAVAGLGGNPYRDGSYEYYVQEKVIDNDPKAEGSFILASLELGR